MLLDTSFLVDLLAGRAEARALAEEVDRAGDTVRIPSPVLFELWVGAAGALRSDAEREKVEDLLRAYEVAPFGEEDAKAAGELQAQLSRRGRPLGTVDVLVAGAAVARSEVLITGDARLGSLDPKVIVRTYARRRK